MAINKMSNDRLNDIEMILQLFDEVVHQRGVGDSQYWLVHLYIAEYHRYIMFTGPTSVFDNIRWMLQDLNNLAEQ